jgi:hypothetical protein
MDTTGLREAATQLVRMADAIDERGLSDEDLTMMFSIMQTRLTSIERRMTKELLVPEYKQVRNPSLSKINTDYTKRRH